MIICNYLVQYGCKDTHTTHTHGPWMDSTHWPQGIWGNPCIRSIYWVLGLMKEVRRMLAAKIISKQTPPFSCQSHCHNPSFHSRPLTLRTLKPQPWPCSSFTAAETSVCGFLCLWRHWPESVSRPRAHSVNTHTHTHSQHSPFQQAKPAHLTDPSLSPLRAQLPITFWDRAQSE